jgi:hypothetical protein
MKRVLPWLVRWARHARDFVLHWLLSSAQYKLRYLFPLRNYIFIYIHTDGSIISKILIKLNKNQPIGGQNTKGG